MTSHDFTARTAAFDPGRAPAEYSTRWCEAQTREEISADVDRGLSADSSAGAFAIGDAVYYDDHGEARDATVIAVDGRRYIVTFTAFGLTMTVRAMPRELRARA